MADTAKAPRRTKTTTAKKATARPAAKTAPAKTPAPKAAAKTAAKPLPVQKAPPLNKVAELTAADLTGTKENTTPKSAEPASDKMSAAEMVKQTAAPKDEKGTEIMNDVMETTKKYAGEAKERFESAFSEMSEKAKANVEKSTKAFEEISDIAKGNVEAIVESSKIATKGVESFGQDAAEYGRMTFEKASAAMKSLAAAKSPTEFFQLQSELMSSNFDTFAKETAKNSEAILKLAGDVVQPISTRVSVVTEKVRTIAA